MPRPRHRPRVPASKAAPPAPAVAQFTVRIVRTAIDGAAFVHCEIDGPTGKAGIWVGDHPGGAATLGAALAALAVAARASEATVNISGESVGVLAGLVRRALHERMHAAKRWTPKRADAMHTRMRADIALARAQRIVTPDA